MIAIITAVLAWPDGRRNAGAPDQPGLGGSISSVTGSATPTPTGSAPTAATTGSSRSATGRATGAGTSTSLQVPVDPPTESTSDPAAPVRVRVARVGIDSPLESLGLLSNGTLESPTEWQRAGWYAKGVRPGAVGPAVIAGHVDSRNGPAVFYHLRDIRVGDDIAVTDTTGKIRHFTVTDVKSYPKDVFPTAAVYGPSAIPVLRLITCTGDFDWQARSYLDNLVVSAALVGTSAF